RGAPAATVMESLDDFSIGDHHAALVRELGRLYATAEGPLGAFARDTFEAMRRIEELRSVRYQPEHGASYGYDEFSRGLMQVARLLKARVGLEAASVDLNGWDSHLNQSALMAPMMARLGK